MSVCTTRHAYTHPPTHPPTPHLDTLGEIHGNFSRPILDCHCAFSQLPLLEFDDGEQLVPFLEPLPPVDGWVGG